MFTADLPLAGPPPWASLRVRREGGGAASRPAALLDRDRDLHLEARRRALDDVPDRQVALASRHPTMRGAGRPVVGHRLHGCEGCGVHPYFGGGEVLRVAVAHR